MSILKLIKENKKSETYENEEYIVKIFNEDGIYYKKNGDEYVTYDYDAEDGEYIPTKAVTLKITNKKTGKTSQKRCYQGYSVINDVREDLNNNKIQFKTIFDKIDVI